MIRILFILLLLSFELIAQNNLIVLDGQFDDWSDDQLIYSDPSNDIASGQIDLLHVWANNDDRYFYLSFDLNQEIELQDNHDISLYLDLDNNPATGYNFQEIGAELRYFFGFRFGFLNTNESSQLINHSDISLIITPTVNSQRCELMIKTSSISAGYDFAFGEEIGILIIDERSNGDKMPNNNGTLKYILSKNNYYNTQIPEFSKKNTTDIRVLTYNVLNDGPFDFSRKSSIKKLLSAVHADIIAFQEIYNYTSTETLNELRESISNGYPGTWHHANYAPDITIISKYPILQHSSISGNAAFLLEVNERQILLIIAHLPCCDKDSERQLEIDQIMSFIRQAKNGSGDFSIENNTAIIICGDLNLVGDPVQLNTLLTGDIANEQSYGPDFSPDWDGSDFIDVMPLTTGLPATITWSAANSSYAPGRLDFVIYSSSQLKLQKSFALYTPAIDENSLDVINLTTDDSDRASDHLPIITDFNFDFSSDVKNALESVTSFSVFPNPGKYDINVLLDIKYRKLLTLSIINSNGMSFRIFKNKHFLSGKHALKFYNQLPAGLYYFVLSDGANQISKPVVIGIK